MRIVGNQSLQLVITFTESSLVFFCNIKRYYADFQKSSVISVQQHARRTILGSR